MGLSFIILLGIGYLIYQVAFGITKDIKRNEEKIDMLKLQFKQINIKLDEINKKLDNKKSE